MRAAGQHRAVALEEVTIEEAATRPPMMPIVRLPLTMGLFLVGIGAILLVLFTSITAEAIVVGTDVMICLALRPLVATDYNGFDIWLNWLRTDLCCFDTRAWGGASVAPFPLRVSSYYGASDV